jgi:hypothetical protein
VIVVDDSTGAAYGCSFVLMIVVSIQDIMSQHPRAIPDNIITVTRLPKTDSSNGEYLLLISTTLIRVAKHNIKVNTSSIILPLDKFV